MTTLYYNTTQEDKSYVTKRKKKNLTQDEIIFAIFQKYRKLTASEVLGLYPNENVPLTSIRRSITNNMLDGKLIKTNDKKIGNYGSPEKYYELAIIKENNQYLMF